MERKDPAAPNKDKYGSRKIISKPSPDGTTASAIREKLSSRETKQKCRKNEYTLER